MPLTKVDKGHSGMTAEELGKQLGVGRRYVFKLRKRWPEEAPKTFDDVEEWKAFIAANKVQQPVPQLSSRKAQIEEEEEEVPPATVSNISYVDARARKAQIAAEMALIQLEVTRRNIIKKEDVKVLFAKIGAVVRGRFLKVQADLPCSCVGLTEAQIDKVVAEKLTYALAPLDIPTEFFEPQSAV